MSRQRVFVETRDGKIIRIFKLTPFKAMTDPELSNRIREIPRADAVSAIRKQVYERTRGECEWCGAPMTYKQMHLHEKKFRSHGGEISLENSDGICYGCHEGRPDAAHKGLQFGRRRD